MMVPTDIRTLPRLDRDAVVCGIVRDHGGCALESLANGSPGGRFSIYALNPVTTLESASTSPECPFAALQSACRPWCPVDRKAALPFFGGWIGFLSYEAGRFIEPHALPHCRAHAAPLARWSLFDTAIIHDAATGRWLAIGLELPARLRVVGRPTLSQRLDEVERLARDWTADRAGACAEIAPRRGDVGHQSAAADARAGWIGTADEYLRSVDRALEYIRAGDIFQVNIARRYRTRCSDDPLTLYRRLCRANPAAYAAIIPFGEGAVLSSSPELFLSVTGRDAITRPIKGTRPRGRDPAEDARRAAELASSEKDRAELNMIVDLERNDLGRVCEYGSVRVESDGDIERLATVFHRTATIRGRLREDCDAIDLVRAAFPGGSITGAPKVRAMQIIDELEDEPRGPYCGAVGYVGVDGDMMLNLPIRTVVAFVGRAEFSVGSGIVVDSTPEEELAELDAKAAGLLRALSGTGLESGSSAAREGFSRDLSTCSTGERTA